MSEESEDGIHLLIPRSLLAVSWLGLFGLGGGAGLAFAPNLETSAVEACFDNAGIALEQSKIALDVAGQHGEELQNIRASLYEITQRMYTVERHKEDVERWDRDMASIERRLRALEK